MFTNPPVMELGVQCSDPQISDGNDPLKVELEFIDMLIKDGVKPEIYQSTRRLEALACRFAGYRCDNVMKISISPRGTNRWSEKSFAINSVAVHGLKAICVVIRRNDVDKACLGPFYKSHSLEDVMYDLTTAIMSEVADLANPVVSEKPYAVVSVNEKNFHGESGNEASGGVDKATEFLKEKMKMSCSEYTWEKTIETTISAFQQLCPQELTARDLYVCVCRDIQLAPCNLMPNMIEGFVTRGSS